MNDKRKSRERRTNCVRWQKGKVYREISRAQRVNEALYDKIFKQQERYSEWLCSLASSEVLDNVYEYLVREDILMLLGRCDLPYEQARALLDLTDPMDAIFGEYAKHETDRIEDIKKAIQRCAEREMRKHCVD